MIEFLDEEDLNSTKNQKLERKKNYQTFYLKKEFEKGHNWGKKKIQEIASKLNLSTSQVYKWRWDY